jgi:stage V sporulation protein R
MKNDIDKQRKQKLADSLQDTVTDAKELSQRLGLTPSPVKYWIVDGEEMAEAVAYDGFTDRYPHWRWGMKYRQIKNTILQGGKFYEIVVHSDPAHAYLQESNTEAIQKLVITHVFAHADVFNNNKYYKDLVGDSGAARILSDNAEQVQEIIDSTDISRAEVEKWMDHLLCLQANIDQYEYDKQLGGDETSDNISRSDVQERLTEAGFTKETIQAGIDIDEIIGDTDEPIDIEEEEQDLLWYFYQNGMTYDEENERAVQMEDWQLELIDILREEFYLFTPVRLTKTLNEGWAVFWQSMMMTHETFADVDDFVDYAETTAEVLQPGGGSGSSFNPYRVGYDLWKYAENRYNREELLSKLFQVEGITPETFYDIDFQQLELQLQPPTVLDQLSQYNIETIVSEVSEEYLHKPAIQKAKNNNLEYKNQSWKLLSYEGLARRNYSLVRPENRSFLQDTPPQELRQEYRYISSPNKYETIEQALEDISYTYAWDKMRDIRATSNDTTFFERLLNPEFVERNNYFSYGFNYKTGRFEVESTEFDGVKQQLLQEVTNFGKPQIKAVDSNFKNEGRLLLEHKYTGIPLDLPKSRDTIKRIFNLWGRPVHLRTVIKEYDSNGDPKEKGIELIYNPEKDVEISQKKLRHHEYSHLIND